MRLTRAAEYAIRCMVYLSARGVGVLTSRQKIAATAEIPTQFLAKIAQDLARANFIEIRQGSRGGLVLKKDPTEITLLEVVETMIGEIYLNDCVARPNSCNVTYDCAVQRVWMTARDQLRATLNKVTFDQLSKENSCIPTIKYGKIGAATLKTTLPNSNSKHQ